MAGSAYVQGSGDTLIEPRWSTLSPRGTFEFEDLPGGTFEVQLYLEEQDMIGFTSMTLVAERQVTLDEGEELDLSVAWESHRAEIVVRSADGTPVPSLEMLVRGLDEENQLSYQT